jgi:hypothetical protein
VEHAPIEVRVLERLADTRSFFSFEQVVQQVTASVTWDIVRAIFEFLDIGDGLASASAASAETRLAARPLFFKALLREFPRIASSLEGSGGERERSLELAARQR